MKQSNAVFSPGSLPRSTYIIRRTRSGFTYEERLQQALSIDGYMTFISGPSKIGKTVLCEKVIGLSNLIEVSGADFTNKSEMWTTIGAKAGMPASGTSVAGLESGESMSESYILTKESVIDFFNKKKLVLLLDDFHYALPDIQMFMAQQFKDAIRKGLKIIVASLPHRSDDAIRVNPDLQGRISIIDIEAWSEDELKEIPSAGFKELNVSISEDHINRLAKESIYSPQLMQLICLNLCLLEKVDDGKLVTISDEMLSRAFRFSTLNLDYKKAIKVIRDGKNSRGKTRKQYKTNNMGNLDLYGLILESIAIDPPIVSVEFSNLVNRIQALIIDDDIPTSKSIKEYMRNLQEVIEDRNEMTSIIEWKENTLYILEPLFLFYLRWGRNES